ncbi:MAG: hypothetical protein ACLGH8_08860 [Bacteroidia bacterium]
MTKYILAVALLTMGTVQAQEHFAGISTSQRTGILTTTINPSIIAATDNHISVNILSFSGAMLNNKVGFSDLISGTNFDDAIFSGNKAASLRADAQILGPSISLKVHKWVFSFSTQARTQANMVNIDNRFGNAIVNNMISGSVSASILNHDQRASGVAWGEAGIGIARELFSVGPHSLYGGVNFKLLLAGTYINMSSSGFTGELAIQGENVSLTNAQSRLSFAYAGALANDFGKVPNFMDYFGKPGGLSTDVGVNYVWKDESEDSYRITAGAAIKNMGSMNFNADNNRTVAYELNIPQGQYLDLAQFKNESDIKVIEQKLLQSGYVQQSSERKDFKIKLPTTFVLHADVRLYSKFYLGGFLQQKMHSDMNDTQLTAQNLITITPRFATHNFELYVPVTNSEISGTAVGIGTRYRGFYIGSGSVITGLANSSGTHQIDAYMGFRLAL